MIITLTTDFGYKDGFAGILKGVIAGINPQAKVIDLSHGIPHQDITSAALLLRHSVSYFPRGTIHVAIVDPGVGSERRPILIASGGSFFVGPDNGVLSLACAHPLQAIHLTNAVYHRDRVSSTFHGRDIFAPVAAHLSLGIAPESLGEPIQDFVQIAWPAVKVTANGVQGEVIYIDSFGNLFTNISAGDLAAFSKSKLAFKIRGVVIHGLSGHYAAGAPGALIALINSWELLELAINCGSAAQQFGARIGDQVEARMI